MQVFKKKILWDFTWDRLRILAMWITPWYATWNNSAAYARGRRGHDRRRETAAVAVAKPSLGPAPRTVIALSTASLLRWSPSARGSSAYLPSPSCHRLFPSSFTQTTIIRLWRMQMRWYSYSMRFCLEYVLPELALQHIPNRLTTLLIPLFIRKQSHTRTSPENTTFWEREW